MAVFASDLFGRMLPSKLAAGPWDPSAQHGSCPSSLVTRAVERAVADPDFLICRLTVDLMRPVPIAPLEIVVDEVRRGRKIRVFNVRIVSLGHVCVQASALAIRKTEDKVPPVALPDPFPHPLPDSSGVKKAGPRMTEGFATCLEMRHVAGTYGEAGGQVFWVRFTEPMVAGEDWSPLMRAVATGDFSNGSASGLDFDTWTFINADLAVDLYRLPVGEWILMESSAWIDESGAGLAMSRLADVNGYIGIARQHLVIAKR